MTAVRLSLRQRLLAWLIIVGCRNIDSYADTSGALGVAACPSVTAGPIRAPPLAGLIDRAEAIGGTITLHSPAGAGTSLDVGLPLAG